MVGQAPVRVIGPVRQHQYIVPSGRNDGTAVAVDKEALSASGDLRSVVGIAWEDADTPSEKRRATRLFESCLRTRAALRLLCS